MLKPISDTEYIFRFLNQNEFIETCDRRYLEPVRLIGVNISSGIALSIYVFLWGVVIMDIICRCA